MSRDIGCSGCLRPAFTQSLAERLTAGESIELISPHGQGRRRTLQDLRQLLPGTLLIFQVNMATYVNDFKGFIGEINFQAGGEFDSLAGLMASLAANRRPCLIILHNFDLLYADHGVDPHFDAAFFDQLNRIGTLPTISLLCVCEASHPGREMRTKPTPLPPLTQVEATAELARRLPTMGADAMDRLAAEIAVHPTPYTRLQQLIDEACP